MGPISASVGAGAAAIVSSSLRMLDLPNQREELSPLLASRLGLCPLLAFRFSSDSAGGDYLRRVLLADVALVAASVLPPVASVVRAVLRAAVHAAAPRPSAAAPLHG